MNKAQYKKLKIGDRVMNVVPTDTYHHGKIDKMSVWNVDALNCPSVCRNRITFAMVRLADDPRIQSCIVSDQLTQWGFA